MTTPNVNFPGWQVQELPNLEQEPAEGGGGGGGGISPPAGRHRRHHGRADRGLHPPDEPAAGRPGRPRRRGDHPHRRGDDRGQRPARDSFPGHPRREPHPRQPVQPGGRPADRLRDHPGRHRLPDLAYGGAYAFPASIGTPVLSSTAGHHDFLAFEYNLAATTWYCVGFVPSRSPRARRRCQGGTGLSSLTAYTLLTGGTTSTGNAQQVAAGTSGQLLQSNGSSALPTWESLDSTATDIALVGTALAAGSAGQAR